MAEYVKAPIKGKEVTDKELMAAIPKEPFRPVEIVLTNGATYQVTHPDGIMIRRRMAAIAVGDVIHTISNAHVNQIIPLKSARSK
jgi:hypothetical protein